jgi:hypothetical protein
MFFYPTIIIDDFLKDPLKVREYGLTLNYGKGNNFSGKRTDNLFNVNSYFSSSICNKILYSCGIPFIEYKAELHFHLTGQEFGESGWPHTDFDNLKDTKFACIIYLNIQPNGLDSGTSIFRVKNFKNIDETVPAMQTTFKTGQDNLEEKNSAIDNYEETVRVGGIFNRMVAYDSRRPHCGNGYFGDTTDSQRLTLLAFFKEIELSTPYRFTPIVYADMVSKV